MSEKKKRDVKQLNSCYFSISTGHPRIIQMQMPRGRVHIS